MDPAAATDEELANHISSRPPGEARDAEAELYRRLAPRARLWALRHLRNEHAAADLVQQALLLTIERLRADEVREPGRLGAFVLGSCRMIVRQGMRRAARTARLLDEYARTFEVSETLSDAPLDRDRLVECLARLAERERSLLVLTFFVERTADEIATELSLSAANVRVIRHRALARLRGCMQGVPA
jgi:RNA polymerase sigma-70 factor (ECF subfamily)